jgi:hypothetical protein
MPLARDVGAIRAKGVAERRWAEEREDVAAQPPWLSRAVTSGAGRTSSGGAPGIECPGSFGAFGAGRTGVVGAVGRPGKPVPGPPPGPVGGPCGVVVAGVDGAGTAAAAVVARPTTSSEPAGSPACSAMSLTFSPVTALAAERGLAEVVELVCPRTSSVPQSASGTWRFALAATG